MIAGVIREAHRLAPARPADAVQLIENTDRALVGELLQMKDVIDLVVPRGGAELIRYVAENATMPVLIGGIGVCHTYVDAAADVDKAVRNRPQRQDAQVQHLQRPRHAARAQRHRRRRSCRRSAARWADAGVEMHCDERSLAILERPRSRREARACAPRATSGTSSWR